MDAALERLVRRRARRRCEYCRLPQAASGVPFEIDHIIARQHHGRTVTNNLAVSCVFCNGRIADEMRLTPPECDSPTRAFGSGT
jgi:5-methylcytosine-specific restriction endonuclease McrA